MSAPENQKPDHPPPPSPQGYYWVLVCKEECWVQFCFECVRKYILNSIDSINILNKWVNSHNHESNVWYFSQSPRMYCGT